MTKRHVDDEITLSATFRNSAGTATDPTAVTFTYRVGRNGTDNSVTPVNTATGVYTATFAPETSGPLYGVFKGTGALIKTIPVTAKIHPNQLPVG